MRLPDDLSIRRTPDWLTWSLNASLPLTRLQRIFNEVRTTALAETLAVASREETPKAELVVTEIRRLSPFQYRRILEAPHTMYVLINPNRPIGEKIDYLLRSIRAEKMAEAHLCDGPTNWTAVGDAVFVQAGESRAWARGMEPGWQTRRVAHGIVCDYRSPHALGMSLDPSHGQQADAVVESSEVSLYSPKAEAEISAQLAEALRLVELACKSAYFAIRSFTKAIVVRVDTAPGMGMSSGSDAQFPGRTALINPHLRSDDVAILADALVHESIHHIMYCQEWLEPWVTDQAVYYGDGYRQTSPWSGRELTPRQFMQACFVWYGLYNFWRSDGAKAAFGRERSQDLAATARHGFYGIDLRTSIGEWEAHTTSPIRDAIMEAQLRVVRADFAHR